MKIKNITIMVLNVVVLSLLFACQPVGQVYEAFDESDGDGFRADSSGNVKVKPILKRSDLCENVIGNWLTSGKNFQGDYERIQDSSSIDLGEEDFTLSLWVNPTWENNWHALVVKREDHDTNNDWGLWYYKPDNVIMFNHGNNIKTSLGAAPPSGKWSHISITRSGDILTARVTTDGAARETTAAFSGRLFMSDNDVLIGAGNNADGSHRYKGEISNVVIYKKALTIDELSAIISKGRDGVPCGCIDSDGGINLALKGIAAGKEDECIIGGPNIKTVPLNIKEYRCDGGQPVSTEERCPELQVCFVGACVDQQTCIDTEPEQRLDQAGAVSGHQFTTYPDGHAEVTDYRYTDVCENDNSVRKFKCGSQDLNGAGVSWDIVQCENSCNNGVCETSPPSSPPSSGTCSDSDGGMITNIKGTIRGIHNGQSYGTSDFCTASGNLHEYYCDGNLPKGREVTCNYISTTKCVDGRCI